MHAQPVAIASSHSMHKNVYSSFDTLARAAPDTSGQGKVTEPPVLKQLDADNRGTTQRAMARGGQDCHKICIDCNDSGSHKF